MFKELLFGYLFILLSFHFSIIQNQILSIVPEFFDKALNAIIDKISLYQNPCFLLDLSGSLINHVAHDKNLYPIKISFDIIV